MKRLHLIDEYRGLLVINMIIYHAIWDLVFMFGNYWEWYLSDRQGWRIWIGGSFILVSGFCWQMSKQPLKRGFLVYLGGVIVSVVTILFTPDAKIMFGVLTMIGSSMILMVLLDLLFKKIPPIIGLLTSIVLFLLTFQIKHGYLGFGEIRLAEVPGEWFANGFTTYLGLPEWGFFSADYYPIFPWFFMFVAGYFLYACMFRKKKEHRILEMSICPPLGWIGRHALIIYMIHQPIIYGVLSVWYGVMR